MRTTTATATTTTPAMPTIITKEEIKEQYKSWRGHIIKYNSYKSVTNTDVLYKSLFEG